jgi:hypothetical protein
MGSTYVLQFGENILGDAVFFKIGLDGGNDIVDDRPIDVGLNK